ncbi:2'-5' RNA ligase family protein [Catellatospora methionotrophica]|uniref:2'-5' RNA ligase family protein n=1 Tax=Catellatospora methionotrophica TaxID=121620 RepID=UPI00140D111C|nr:2'-5' RNA ligase family protein [Catellatospora methionotrophica]
MKRFLTGDRVWPPGWTRLHVYLLPELEQNQDLARLVRDWRAAMAPFGFLAPVPDPWLHVTVQPVMGIPAAEISPGERAKLTALLTEALADVPAFTLTAGCALASVSVVLADLDGDLPGEPLHTVHARTRTAISDVLGSEAVAYQAMPGHMTIAYATGSGDSGRVQAALRQVRPAHAALTVREVHLLDVTQDTRAAVYRWTPVARIPLRT